jgi:hypothetical protein
MPPIPTPAPLPSARRDSKNKMWSPAARQIVNCHVGLFQPSVTGATTVGCCQAMVIAHLEPDVE